MFLNFLQLPRTRDLTCRLLLAGVLIGVVTAATKAWPGLERDCGAWLLSLKGGAFSAAVYVAVFAVLGRILMPLLLGQRVWRNACRWVSRGVPALLLQAGRFLVMGLVNTTILAVQLAYAMVCTDNAADRAVDAGTHYVERMADLMFAPGR